MKNSFILFERRRYLLFVLALFSINFQHFIFANEHFTNSISEGSILIQLYSEFGDEKCFSSPISAIPFKLTHAPNPI